MHVGQFIKEYSIEISEGNAAYFIGAGISKPSNLPDWLELLQPYSTKIGISDLKGKNLPLIAQFVINEQTGNRGPFINSIAKKLRKKFYPNIYHDSIVKTNVKTIWTTNYDNLLETAYGNQIVDLKISDDAISSTVPDAQVEIIKMHGCIYHSQRDDIVITEADYEDFFLKRPAISQRLKIDLLQKSFLFLGYGYGDPNISNIVTEARRLAGNSTRQHFLITISLGTPEFQLWANNLRRYGITVIAITDFNELQDILAKLALKSRGKSIFITGSHLSKSNDDVVKLSSALAKEEDIILNDGQSTGIMRLATQTFMEKVIDQKSDVNKQLKFYPNPYAANPRFANDSTLLPLLKQWRLSLFKATQIVLAFDGGMGTKAEIEKAIELGCIVVPYFKQEKTVLWNLLDDPGITSIITKYDKKYIAKVKSKKVKIEDVIELIKAIFSSND